MTAEGPKVYLWLEGNFRNVLFERLALDNIIGHLLVLVEDAAHLGYPGVLIVDDNTAPKAAKALRGRAAGQRLPLIVVMDQISADSLYQVIDAGYLELAGLFRQADLEASLAALGKLAGLVRRELARWGAAGGGSGELEVGSQILRGNAAGKLTSLFIDPPMREFLRELAGVLSRVRAKDWTQVAERLSEDDRRRLYELFRALRRGMVAEGGRPGAGRSAVEGLGLGEEQSTLLKKICEPPSGLANLPRTHILIEGETGTGKTLVARWIADYLRRSEDEGQRRTMRMELLHLNVAALPPSLVESELFGSVQGAYTDAPGRPGIFLLGYGQVVFLDEVGELSPEVQAKLLVYLDTYAFRPLGWPVEEDVVAPACVIAATNQDLAEKVRRGEFRRDLYHRFRYRLRVPPLRARREDLPVLVDLVLQDPEVNPGLAITAISDRALEALGRHPFPGNFRELEDVLGRACILALQEGATRLDEVHVYRAFLP